METKTILSLITILFVFAGYTPYIIDTIKGKTRPHVFSYFLWFFITLIIFFLQLESGGGAGSWITLVLSLIMLLIFILGLKNGKKDIKKIDYVFLVATLIAILIWWFADQPVFSAFLLIAIDVFAFIPTVRKSWVDPWSETLSLYVITMFRHGLAIVALSQINLVTALFPATWLFMNIFFSILLVTRRRKLSSN